ncbi:hypothetical protein RRG08_018131 [Elysia crispata]|uniref:Uncharacterized protein n=1 Tax=Elysia crispata TaxID=231223 RepID=A0AAE0YDD6_9GAST|nr:hypothetical protein RRG08_018131 [Elysia crispata]
MKNPDTPTGGQIAHLQTWTKVNPRYLAVVLVIIIGTCLAYLLSEIPFLEKFRVPRMKTMPSLQGKASEMFSKRADWSPRTPLEVEKHALLSDSTTQELETLDQMIKQFNEKAAKSWGIAEKYTGEQSAVAFLKWTIGKVIDLTNKMKASRKKMNGQSSVGGKKQKSVFNIQKNSRTQDLNATIRLTKAQENKGEVSENLRTGIKGKEYKVKTKSKVAKTIGDPHIRLVLFSTWIDKPEKREAHDNVLRTWRLWEPLVVPLVFTNDSNITTRAHSFGWKVLPEPRCGCISGRGVPLLREMYRSAMATFDSHLYAFVNGDLLLGNGMLSTIEAIVKDKALMAKPLMGLINRINVDFYHTKSDGKPMTDGSSDGFITNKLFPWQHVPDIVPGRKGVAMWLVSYAREMGVATVDVSGSLRAVHMMATKFGNNESGGNCNHKIYNKLRIKPKSWFCGFFKCAQYKTTREGSQVKIEDKSSQNHPRCGECEMDLEAVKSNIY